MDSVLDEAWVTVYSLPRQGVDTMLNGNPVKIRNGPAAVTGDENRYATELRLFCLGRCDE